MAKHDQDAADLALLQDAEDLLLLQELEAGAVSLKRPPGTPTPGAAPIDQDAADLELLREVEAAQAGPPGLFQRVIGEPAGRIGEAAEAGFETGFGEGPLRPTPQVRTGIPALDPIANIPSQVGGTLLQVGEAGLRGLGGLYGAFLATFHQTLKEAGASDTTAGQLTRDAAAFIESSPIAAAATPGAVARGARKVGRRMIGARTFDAKRAQIQADKAQRARERALNRARLEAAEKAPPGSTAGELRAQTVDLAGRRLDDVELRLQGADLLRQPDELITEVMNLTDLRVRPEVAKRAMGVASDILKSRGIPPNSLTPQRVQQLIADLLNTDDAFSVRLFADIEASGMSKTDFLAAFLHTGTQSARNMNILSQFWGRTRRQAMRGDKNSIETIKELVEARDASGRRLGTGPMLSPVELGQGVWKRAGSIYRRLLTSLPATAARNFIDGNIRMALEGTQQAIDQSFQRLFVNRKITGGKRTPEEIAIRRAELSPVGDSFDILGRTWVGVYKDGVSKLSGGRIPPSKVHQSLDRLLDAFPEIEHRAFASASPDIARLRAGGDLSLADKFEMGVDKWSQALNRTQEFVIRRAALATNLDVNLKKVGSSLEDMVDGGNIPAGFQRALHDAIESTLELTYALPPVGKRGLKGLFKSLGDTIERSRIGVFMIPFPRFIFNQVKFLMENLPTGGIRLMGPKNRAKIAEGDFSPLAREITSSAMLATAFAIRQGEFPGLTPGEKYDEVLTEDGSIASLAPFAQIVPYLFVADMSMRLDEGRILPSTDLIKEIARGFLGSAPQVGRASNAIQDAVRALGGIKSTADIKKLSEFVGDTPITGFLRPLQLVRDFRSEWNEAVNVKRQTRGIGVAGPIRDLLAPETLPELELATREGPAVAPRQQLPGGGSIATGLASQVSGIRLKPGRNLVESELTRLGFGPRHVNPQTGDAQADELIKRFQGPILGPLGDIVLSSDLYKNLPVRTQQEVLRNMLNVTRDVGRASAKFMAPALFARLSLDRMPAIQRGAIEEQLDIIFRSRGEKTRAADLFSAFEALGRREAAEQGL